MDQTTKVINDVKIEATHLPFRCPVCNGFGTLKYGEIKCQACDGKGFVVIRQDDDRKTEDDNQNNLH